jgi:hypothetical protein
MNLCTWNKVVGEGKLKIFWKVTRQINWKIYLNHIKTFFHKINKHINLPANSVMDRKKYFSWEVKGDKEVDEEKWTAPYNKQNKFDEEELTVPWSKKKNGREEMWKKLWKKLKGWV